MKYEMKLYIQTQTYNTATDVWEWISTGNLIPHFIVHVITYTCWDQS